MKFVTIYEEYRHKFFRLPQVFFANEKYQYISNDAKVAWALLCNRASLSKKNNWYDKGTGRVYFIFRNEELMELLNIKSSATLAKVKKELTSAKLIHSERRGFNKPNKMYLIYPEITEADLEAIDNFESNKIDSNVQENLELQGRLENEHPVVQKVNTINTEYSNNNIYINKDRKDTKNLVIKDRKFKELYNYSRENRKKSYIENAFYSNEEKIPVRLADMLRAFSENPTQANEYYNIIIKAKQNTAKNFGISITLEVEPELVDVIINCFSRVIRKIEQSRSIENANGYIYKAIYDSLCKELSVRSRQDKNDLDSVYYNWLNEDSN